MQVDRLHLGRTQGQGLLGQLVLQLGHADVHGQRGQAQAVDLQVGPGQHAARGQHAHHRHQHRVGGAVHAGLAGRQVHQRKQGGIGLALGQQGEVGMQLEQPGHEMAVLALAQHVAGPGLDVVPVGARGRVGDGGGRALGPLAVAHELGGRDGAQGPALAHHGVQLAHIGAVAFSRFVGVHAQAHAAQGHLLQFLARLDHIAFLGQQHPGGAAQDEGQRLTHRDGFEFQLDELHRPYQLRYQLWRR
jgi:hypothetical protein